MREDNGNGIVSPDCHRRIVTAALSLSVLSIVTLMALATPADESQPERAFDIRCPRSGDAVAVTRDGARWGFTVTSERGIGSATIARRDVPWPTNVTFRLKLGGLELLDIQCGAARLHASVQSHSGFGRTVQLTGADGKALPVDDTCLHAACGTLRVPGAPSTWC